MTKLFAPLKFIFNHTLHIKIFTRKFKFLFYLLIIHSLKKLLFKNSFPQKNKNKNERKKKETHMTNSRWNMLFVHNAVSIPFTWRAISNNLFDIDLPLCKGYGHCNVRVVSSIHN